MHIQPSIRSVCARIYRGNNLQSQPVQVFYREDPDHLERGRFVLASEELTHHKTQSYIHDCIVSVTHSGKSYKFRIFFKCHKFLPTNQGILQSANVEMDGDVLVVACGKRVTIRNLRNNIEVRAAEKAVKKFAQHIDPFRTRRTFPAAVSL
ncbi:hypothetical protein F5879DRAFT_925620 [Lentinula edodes]|nr:hypothetical protein F5879DRAFT_925620 [Lentinula edodes]